VKVVVVGGGVAGLTCALALRERGHEVIVVEREAQAGGKVRTERVGPWQVEWGPAGVLDNVPETMALFARVGVEPIVSSDASRRRFVVRDGRLRELPDSPPKLLVTRTLTVGEKLRLIGELRVPKRVTDGDETLAEFARRRFGADLAARFVEPIVSGVYAGDYARLSAASAFPRLVELERAHGSLLRGMVALERERRRAGLPRKPARLTTLRGGMGALPRALAARLDGALRTGEEALAIERAPSGLAVRTPSGALAADRVVLALPPDDAARLARPLDAAIADAYAAIPSVGVVAVSLGYARADVGHPLDGFGFLAPRAEKLRVLGVIWMTSAFPSAGQAPDGHVLLRCLIGGAHDPAAPALSDEELTAIAREGLRATLGLAAQPRFVHVLRWASAIAQYEVGHAARSAIVDERGRAIGLHACGAALHGVGVNDVIRDGLAVAERISTSG
jgi:oxygen-dependent protoporphyrinogen oxidase